MFEVILNIKDDLLLLLFLWLFCLHKIFGDRGINDLELGRILGLFELGRLLLLRLMAFHLEDLI
jgi:hypothetical protein